MRRSQVPVGVRRLHSAGYANSGPEHLRPVHSARIICKRTPPRRRALAKVSGYILWDAVTPMVYALSDGDYWHAARPGRVSPASVHAPCCIRSRQKLAQTFRRSLGIWPHRVGNGPQAAGADRLGAVPANRRLLGGRLDTNGVVRRDVIDHHLDAWIPWF